MPTRPVDRGGVPSIAAGIQQRPGPVGEVGRLPGLPVVVRPGPHRRVGSRPPRSGMCPPRALLGYVRQQVSREMHPTPLVPRPLERAPQRRDQTGMLIATTSPSPSIASPSAGRANRDGKSLSRRGSKRRRRPTLPTRQSRRETAVSEPFRCRVRSQQPFFARTHRYCLPERARLDEHGTRTHGPHLLHLAAVFGISPGHLEPLCRPDPAPPRDPCRTLRTPD